MKRILERFEVVLEYLLHHNVHNRVFLVKDNSDSNALKILKIKGDGSTLLDVEREMELMKRVTNQDHVVKCFECGTTTLDGDLVRAPSSPSSSSPYLCLEYVKGESLEMLMRRETSFEELRALKFAKLILEGIKAMHASAVVHGGICTENIMVFQHGPEHIESIKIVNFKCAYSREKPLISEKDHLYYYWSPEQALGLQQHNSNNNNDTFSNGMHADIWALAIILFRMLTGTWPFQSTIDANPKFNKKSDEEKKKIVLEAILSTRTFAASALKDITSTTRQLLADMLQRQKKKREMDVTNIGIILGEQISVLEQVKNDQINLERKGWKEESDQVLRRVAAMERESQRNKNHNQDHHDDNSKHHDHDAVQRKAKIVNYNHPLRRTSALEGAPAPPRVIPYAECAATQPRQASPSKVLTSAGSDIAFWNSRNDCTRMMLQATPQGKKYLRDIARIDKLPLSLQERRKLPLEPDFYAPLFRLGFYDGDVKRSEEEEEVGEQGQGQGSMMTTVGPDDHHHKGDHDSESLVVESLSFWAPSNRHNRHLATAASIHRKTMRRENRSLYRL